MTREPLPMKDKTKHYRKTASEQGSSAPVGAGQVQQGNKQQKKEEVHFEWMDELYARLNKMMSGK